MVLKLVCGCIVDDGDLRLKWRQAIAHTGLNPVACVCMCRFRKTRAVRDYATFAGGSRTYLLPDDTSIRKFDSHSREPRS